MHIPRKNGHMYEMKNMSVIHMSTELSTQYVILQLPSPPIGYGGTESRSTCQKILHATTL